MDTSLKMADEHHVLTESVVIDETCDFVFEAVINISTKELVRAWGELKNGMHVELCEEPIRNLPKLTGIAFGPGLIRQCGKTLGPYDGCGFVMDAIVESARVVKQLNDSPVEVPKNLDTFDAVALKTFEMTVRPDLVNSCAPYQDGIEKTFAERGVYPTVRADLYAPKPGQVNRFRRDKIIEVRVFEDGIRLYEYMTDDSHEMKVDLHLDKTTKRIIDIEARAFKVPYHNICELPFVMSKELVGLRADNEFGNRVRERIGGSSGCTHLVDMILDTTRYLNAID